MLGPFVFSAIIFLAGVNAIAAGSNAAVAPENSAAPLNPRIQQLIAKVKSSLRPLKAGTFEMGDWGPAPGRHYDFERDSSPLHKVTLDGFHMMAYKVTYEDFDTFTDATGAARVDMDEISIRNRAPKRPAGVNWFGAKAYCGWLGKITGMAFDLPTEAQWEYAARSGGKRVLFATDNGKLDRGRNFPKEWQDGAEPPLPNVGSFPPNPAGLYGMSEDTGEWVNDWYDEKYYSVSPPTNPHGPESGTFKTQRGSVGGSAEIAAAVFMRAKRPLRRITYGFPDGSLSHPVEVPIPGYSGYKVDNFRCAVNATSGKH
jgi:formylglycine-generating enzyme required for sulfatase activity